MEKFINTTDILTKTRIIANKYNIRYDKNATNTKRIQLKTIPNYENQYIISQDYQDSYKTWYWTENLTNLLSFLNECDNLHLYETLSKSLCKCYFDFDKLSCDRDGIHKLIDDFIIIFNRIFEKTISKDDLIVLYREKDIIESIHIIIPSISMPKTQLKYFVEKYLPHADKSIYTPNRFFNMKNQNKLSKKDKPLFTDFLQPKKQIDYMINYTKDIETCILNYDNEISNPTPTDYEIPKPKSNKPKSKSKPIVITQNNIVDIFLSQLPKEFFTSKLWCSLSKNIYFHDIPKLDMWLEKSADHHTDYSYTTNKDYVLNADEKFKTHDFKSIIEKINDKYGLNYVYVEKHNNNTRELRKWISEISGVSEKYIDNQLSDNFNLRIIELTNNIKIHTKTLDVYIGKDKFNYWTDKVYCRTEEDESIERFITKSKAEIGELSKEFMKNDNKLLGVNMKWGEGKSHIIVKPLVKEIINSNDENCILMITESNNLNCEVYKDYHKVYGDIVQQHINNNFSNNTRIVICSLESLYKVDGFEFHTIIMDEYESIIQHLESTTMYQHETPTQSLNRIISLIKSCKKLICLDADLSYNRLYPIIETCDIKDIELYYSSKNKWKEEYKFNVIVDDEELFIDEIENDIKHKRKLSIGSMSKNFAERLYFYLYTKYIENKKNPIKILCKWSETYKINNTNIIGDEVHKSINDVINDNDIDILLYTPTIKTGVSYNRVFQDNKPLPDRFDKTYLRTNIYSCCAREALQMIFRVRDLSLHTIIVSIGEITPIIETPTDDQIIKYLLENIEFSFHNDDFEKLKKNIIDINSCMMSDIYKKIKILNSRESIDSLYNLPHEILKKLTNNHNLKVKFVNKCINDPNKIDKIKDDMDKANRDFIQYQAKLYANHTEYIKDHTQIHKLEKLSILDPHNNDRKRALTKKKMINTLNLRTCDEYIEYRKRPYYIEITEIDDDDVEIDFIFYKKPIRQVELIDKEELTYYYNDENNIVYEKESRNKYIQDKSSIFEKFLLRNQTTDIGFINKFRNNMISDNEDYTITHEDTESNRMKIIKYVIEMMTPFIYNKHREIQYKTHKYPISKFMEVMVENTEVINERFNLYINLFNYTKKEIIKDFSITNGDQVKEIYKFLKSCLNKIGFDIQAPKNKSTIFYNITPHKTIYNNRIVNRQLENVIVINEKDNIDLKYFKPIKNKKKKADYKLSKKYYDDYDEDIEFYKSGNRYVNYPYNPLKKLVKQNGLDDIPEQLIKRKDIDDMINRIRQLKKPLDNTIKKDYERLLSIEPPSYKDIDKMINGNLRLQYFRDVINDTKHYQRYRLSNGYDEKLYNYYYQKNSKYKYRYDPNEDKTKKEIECGKCMIDSDSDDDDEQPIRIDNKKELLFDKFKCSNYYIDNKDICKNYTMSDWINTSAFDSFMMNK